MLMPSRNRVKLYLNGTIYHIYNRGIDSREIFREGEDYEFFQGILKRYLGKYTEEISDRYKAERPYIRKHKQEMNLKQEIDLLTYCLLPDHFHLLVRQRKADGITKLMRRVMTNYVMYFNKKYKRKGNLFENVYRAVIVPEDTNLVELTCYIHLNPVARVVRRYGPVETVSSSSPEYYMYSSYQDFLGIRQDEWLKPEIVLEKFKLLYPEEDDYKTYMEKEEGNKWHSLDKLILEENRR
jgi:putative transposase